MQKEYTIHETTTNTHTLERETSNSRWNYLVIYFTAQINMHISLIMQEL
jgi:hypothetical protein